MQKNLAITYIRMFSIHNGHFKLIGIEHAVHLQSFEIYELNTHIEHIYAHLLPMVLVGSQVAKWQDKVNSEGSSNLVSAWCHFIALDIMHPIVCQL